MNAPPLPWIARLPAGLFAIPFGLFGLAGTWRRAHLFGWDMALPMASFLGGAGLLIGALLLVLYALKVLRFPLAVRNEFAHPVGGPLMALIPISILMMVVFYGQKHSLAWLLLVLGALTAQAAVAIRVVAQLATNNLKSLALTPALYLPPVGGGLVGAMALNQIGYPGWGALLFGMGLVSWALLETRILNKLFEGPLPEPMRPTVGIELAPASVATLAAGALWPAIPGEVLIVGLGIACGPLVAVLARYRWWSAVPFSAGFWSFSFPSAALASAVIEVVVRGQWPASVGATALGLACLVYVFLIVRTVLLLLQGRLLPPAAAPAVAGPVP